MKPALALLKKIEENEICASYYKEGSSFYAQNYEKWKETAEILIQKSYTVSQVTEMKEIFQRELVSLAKAKHELKKEENLINEIFFEKSRIQVPEKIMADLGVKENTRETDTMQKEISTEEKRFRSLSNRVSFPSGKIRKLSADISRKKTFYNKKNCPWRSYAHGR